MAVVDFERARVEALARELAAAFQRSAQGALIVDASTVEDIDRWRRGARRAGRLLGIHVRTGMSNDETCVWMVEA